MSPIKSIFDNYESCRNGPANKICIMKKFFFSLSAAVLSLLLPADSDACTGIAFTAGDGSRVVARTTEWGNSVLNSSYVISPRGHKFTSLTPGGESGLPFTAKYGYVGIATEMDNFVVEGVNETGLSAGLFFFPGYGGYTEYSPDNSANTLVDMQFVSWVLSSFSSIDEVKEAICSIDIVALDPRAGTVHWRISEPTGRMVVLEIVDGVPEFYENRLGVLTNSPGFEWQMTNLNNYVSLRPGPADGYTLGGVDIRAFGAGAGMFGLPGDVTPPSRFVRAAFYQATAPKYATGYETVMLGFQILSNFNIPIGVEHVDGKVPEGLPSATQWTAATDQKALRFYYRTAWNSTIRCIDLAAINFSRVKYQSYPLDEVREEPVEMIRVR